MSALPEFVRAGRDSYRRLDSDLWDNRGAGRVHYGLHIAFHFLPKGLPHGRPKDWKIIKITIEKMSRIRLSAHGHSILRPFKLLQHCKDDKMKESAENGHKSLLIASFTFSLI